MCWSGVFIQKVDLPLQQKREDQQLAELSLSGQRRKAREANASTDTKAFKISSIRIDPDDLGLPDMWFWTDFHLSGKCVNQDLGTLVCQSHKIPVVEDGEHGQHCKPSPEYKPICSLPPSVTSDSGEEHNLKDNGNDYQRFKHTSIFLLLSLDGQPIATFPICALIGT